MKKMIIAAFALLSFSVAGMAQAPAKTSKTGKETVKQSTAKTADNKMMKAPAAMKPAAATVKTETVKTKAAPAKTTAATLGKAVEKPVTAVKKDGTPDKRYTANKHLKKDGTPDKRFKEHKKG